jgi:uncharacterized membrane protein
MIVEFFTNYRIEIIYLHIISAVIWVGGMISLRYAAHNSLQSIEDPKIKLTRVSHSLKRLFVIVAPFIIILLITAIILAIGLGFRQAALDVSGHIIDKYRYYLYNLIHVKESIWTIMTLNYIIMVILRYKAQKFIELGDLVNAKAKLTPIAKYMVPSNIILGLIAIFLGVYLRISY